MEETGREEQEIREPLKLPGAARPAWADEADQEQDRPGKIRPPALWRENVDGRAPVPGGGDDGLWVHVTETSVLVAIAAVVAAILVPRQVPWLMFTLASATVTAVTWYTAQILSRSAAVAWYLTAWGAVLTAWLTAARIAGVWHDDLFGLLLCVLVLIPVGVTVIRRHRELTTRAAEIGRDTANVRESQYWEGLLARFGVRGVTVRDVIRTDGGRQVHCRLGKYNGDGRKPTGIEGVRELAGPIAQHKRLEKGAVYIEEDPAGGSSADFIIHVRSVAGPRLARYLPAENTLLSINRAFGLGVFDSGREFMLKLREVRVFIVGLVGSGKSTLLNVLIAQLCRMPDALIFMIDLKGGQEARAWLMPWIRGEVARPPIDWLATTREEADVMLDALKRAGQARAESGRHGRKLRPSRMYPALIPICDESTAMTGHMVREDGLSNTKLALKLLTVAEMFRSVAIDPVVSSVRAVVDNTGNSGFKAMSGVRIGMRVATVEEGRQLFPDNIAAARQLSQLRDKGSGIPMIEGELFPPVHFYNITDGEPDDDGHPTEDRITPVVLATAERRPMPEQLIRDAMNSVTVRVGNREMGVYDARWEQPHIAQLIQTWRTGDGLLPPPDGMLPDGPPARGRIPGTQAEFDAEFEELSRELDSLDGVPDDGGEDRQRLNPARKRMYQLLMGRGREGWRADPLWNQLLSEGHTCARETMHRWLAAAEKSGYVYRTGKPRSRWIWRLPEGAEFDIPGMDT